MHFEFATANRIIFGPGTVAEAPTLAHRLGQRAFIVTDSPERAVPLLDSLGGSGLSFVSFLVEKEPDIDLVIMATRTAQKEKCNLVIGMGGGSVLDTGKAVAALLTNPGDIFEYLEVVGQCKPLEESSAPYIAIPTTAGTGSEVTRNAVIASPENKVKVSLRSPTMLPRVAIVDPELTYSLPPEVTASTGMDALTQCIEPFVCSTPTPLTDAICREGIRRAARGLQKAYRNGKDAAAREDMSLASLFGGLALANARLGAVHGFAGPIGGMFPAPHGAACARLLPLVVEENINALQSRAPDSPVLERYAEIAQILTGDPRASAESGTIWLLHLAADLRIPPLSVYGITPADFPAIVGQARKASSMKGNPIELTYEELAGILRKAIQSRL